MTHLSRGGPSAALTTALLTLLGCQTYEADPLVPLDELQLLHERGQTVLERPEREPASPDWFPLATTADPTDGLTLAECNTFALWNAPAVVGAWQDRASAEARLIGAGLYRNPTLSIQPVISSSGSGSLVPIQLTWPLPIWGVRSANEDAARDALRTSELLVADAELSTLTEVRSLAIRLWFDDRSVDALREAEARLGALAEQLRPLEEAGSLDAVTLWAVERQLRQMTDRRLQAELTLGNDTRALRRSLGLPPDSEVGFRFDASVLELPEPPAGDDSTEERLLALPALRALETTYRVRESELRREIAKQYPQLSLGPAAELDLGDDLYGAALQAELPLAELNEGGIANALTERTKARLDFRNALLAALHERAASRATVETLTTRLDVLRELADERAEATELALRNRVGAGVAEASTLINATAQLFQLRLDQIELERARTIARLQAAIRSGHPLILEKEETER